MKQGLGKVVISDKTKTQEPQRETILIAIVLFHLVKKKKKNFIVL